MNTCDICSKSNSYADLFARLRGMDGYLCPEPGGAWSVSAVDGSSYDHIFTGFGDTPEEALLDAEKQHKEWKAKNSK